MKFRRNVKEEKMFKMLSLISLILFVILLACYLITSHDWLIDLVVPSLFLPPLFFFVANLLKNNFIEFQKDKIIMINGNFRSIDINISDIEEILIPSPTALKSKMKDNAIFFKMRDGVFQASYDVETEKYIKENIEVRTEYYDNCSRLFKK